MKIEEIRDLSQAVPFQPFTSHAAGGTPVHVAHPDFIALSPTGRTATVYTLDSKSHRLDVLLIGQIDVQEASASVPDASQTTQTKD